VFTQNVEASHGITDAEARSAQRGPHHQSFLNKRGTKSRRNCDRLRRGRFTEHRQETGVSEVRSDASPNTTEIEVLDAKERWSEYRLADGTTMRVKSVVIAVFRDEDQKTADGEPIYSMKSTLITDVRTAGQSAKMLG
jgi:hypothetical protein